MSFLERGSVFNNFIIARTVLIKVKRLLVIIGCLLLFMPAIGRTAGLEIAFTGVDVYHLTYNFQPTGWGTLYPDLTRETTDIVLLQYRWLNSNDGVVETSLASGASGIQGAYRLAGMGSDSFRFTVTEYYKTYNETTGKWEEGSLDRGSIDWLKASREIDGVLQFNEEYDGAGAADITWGTITVPGGKSIILKNMAIQGQARINVNGSATIEGCTGLDLLLSGAMDGSLSLDVCTFNGMQIDEVGLVSITGCTFFKDSAPEIGATTAVGSLSIQDSTFLDGGSFTAANLCRLHGCDFLRGTAQVDIRADNLSVHNNVFSADLQLKIVSLENPITPVPDISGNSFLGHGAVTTIDLLGNVDAYAQPIPLAGNYWGGRKGPRPKNDDTWLDQWGCYNRYYNGTDSVLETGTFHAAAAPAPASAPPPAVWVESYRWGQNTLAGLGRKGRDTLLCYDIRADVESLSGAQFWVTVDGQRFDPSNSGFVVHRDYGTISADNNMDRTLNFLLPAAMTNGDAISIKLYMDLSSAGPFDVDVGPTILHTFSLTLNEPPARPLRLGLTIVDVRLSGFNPAAPSSSLNELRNLLKLEIPAMLPLTPAELEIKDLGAYPFDGGTYVNWALSGWRPLLAHRLSWSLDEFLTTYNASVSTAEKIDYLIAILPRDALGSGSTGTSYARMPRICLVDGKDPGTAMHELGHAIGNIYRSTEQYDLKGETTYDGERIDEGVGLVIQGVTAFNPEGERTPVVMRGRRHFPPDTEVRAWDIMSNNTLLHWIIPSTLSAITGGLQKVLSQAAAGANALKPLPANGFRQARSAGYRVVVQGLISSTEYGYKIIPGSLSCRRAEAGMGGIVGEVSLVSDSYQAYYDDPRFFAYDAYGNELYAAQCRRRNRTIPYVASWMQTFDVPENAVKFEIRAGRDGRYDELVFSRMIGPDFTTGFNGPDPGSQLGDRITLSWNDAVDGETAAAAAGIKTSLATNSDPETSELSHQLYYSVDGGSRWAPLGTPTFGSTVEIPTDFLPAGADIAFKLLTSDGFRVSEKIIDNLSLANRPPTVTIVAPVTDSQAATGALWTLEAQAYDPEDGTLSQGLWTSSQDGDLGTDADLDGVILSEGVHSLTFTVRDSQGLTVDATVSVSVGTMNDVDLRIDSDALGIIGHGLDPVAGISARLQIGETNTISITVQNQGVDNQATLEVFLTPPDGRETSMAVESFSWKPFGQHSIIFNYLAELRGTYAIRAIITCDNMTDPDSGNNEYIWTLANQPPVAFGDILPVTEGQSVAFDLSGYDPDGDPLNFSIQDIPRFGNVQFVPADNATGMSAHYEYTGAAYGGTDSFTFTASDGQSVSDPATIYLLVAPATVIPDAPTDVAADDGVQPDSITVNWSTVRDAGGYKLYRNTVRDAGGAELIATTLTATTYTDTDVTPGNYNYYWVKAENDAGSSTFSLSDIGFAGEENRRLWSFTAQMPVSSSPAVAPDGTLYLSVARKNGEPGILFDDYYLHALTPDGKEVWTSDTVNFSGSPALGANGWLYYSDREVIAFDPAARRLKWSYDKDGVPASMPAIGPGSVVYINTIDYYVRALDGITGDTIWSQQIKINIGDNFYLSPPSVGTDGTVYSGFEDGVFYALEPADGSIRWSFNTGGSIGTSGVVGANGLVYVVTRNGIIYALRENDGSLAWSYDTGATILAPAVIGPAQTLYVCNSTGKVTALNSVTGAAAWSTPFNVAGAVWTSPAIAADGSIYVAGRDGLLYALNGINGNLLWSVDIGTPLESAPAVGPNGDIYVGGADNKLYALRGRGGGLAAGPWTKYRGNAASSGQADAVAAPSLREAIQALQIMAGKSGTIIALVYLADINQDGRIGMAEVLNLLRELVRTE